MQIIQQHIQPKTPAQDALLRAIRTQQLVVATGPAGVGKTYLAVQSAVNLLAKGEVQKIVLTRSATPTGRSIGFFPGDVSEKLAPWLAPMISELVKRIGKAQYTYLFNKGQIELLPLETVRGASYDNTIVLVDEAQNLLMEELKAITTRIGEHSRMVLMGDPQQRDQRTNDLTNFTDFLHRNDIDAGVVHFGVEDIVRSDIVAKLVKAFLLEGL